jgi:pyruvate/2-oxoglutarate dehydrogenase complex dihydrolipoamide dehydrogenase (E3) component
MKYEYDLAVLGAGSGGLVAAVGATKLGLSTILINGGPIGGDCLNFGCVPSKALLYVAKTFRTARKAAQFGAAVDTSSVDYEAVKARIKEVQDGIRVHEDAAWFRQMGMDVVEEYAEFAEPNTIIAGKRRITARLILIATGSRAAVPPIPGLVEAGFVTNEEIFDLPTLPRHLAVIGGGPIGVEMAWAYRQLGCEVTVLQGAPEILPKDDPELVAIARGLMEADGVKFLTSIKVNRVERGPNEIKHLYIDREGKTEVIEADQLLVAAGRKPNVDRLKMENAGVNHDRTGIKVDASQRTNVRHIYAVGDVTGGLMFTHSASLQAGTFIKKAIFHLPAKTSFHAFPWVTYIQPELASVGLNEPEAKRLGIPYVLARAQFSENDRARAESATEGIIKVLIEPSRLFGLRGGKILGAQIVGPNAGELIHEFVIMMKHGLKASQITAAVHAYPTLSEANKRAVSTMLGEKLFQPRTRKWLGKLFGFSGRLDPGTKANSHGE